MNPYQPPSDIPTPARRNKRRKFALLLMAPGLVIAALATVFGAVISLIGIYASLGMLWEQQADALESLAIMLAFLLWTGASAYGLSAIPAWYRHHADTSVKALRHIRLRLLIGLLVIPGGLLFASATSTGQPLPGRNAMLVFGALTTLIAIAALIQLTQKIRAAQNSSENTPA